MNQEQRKKDFLKILRGIDYSRSDKDCFRDFVTFTRFSFTVNKSEKIVEDVQSRMNTYKDQESVLKKYGGLLDLLIEALTEEPRDFLGAVCMELGTNSNLGQCFTPDSLAEISAEMSLSGIKDEIDRKGFATIYEPTCGAGSMILACARVLSKLGVDYQRQICVTGVDLDRLVADMCFVQVSLCGIPAVIYHGNTLSNEMFDTMPTVMFIRDGWCIKLRKGKHETRF